MNTIKHSTDEYLNSDFRLDHTGFRTNAPTKVVHIPHRPFESKGGNGWIYCYYFPYVKLAQLRSGRRRWPCKVGLTTKGVEEYVASQFKQSGVFEGPEVGFYSRVSDVSNFENLMHGKLKVRKLRTPGAGNEWFETNIGEVRRAFREVRWPGPINLPRRVFLSLLMFFPKKIKHSQAISYSSVIPMSAE